ADPSIRKQRLLEFRNGIPTADLAEIAAVAAGGAVRQREGASLELVRSSDDLRQGLLRLGAYQVQPAARRYLEQDVTHEDEVAAAELVRMRLVVAPAFLAGGRWRLHFRLQQPLDPGGHGLFLRIRRHEIERSRPLAQKLPDGSKLRRRPG